MLLLLALTACKPAPSYCDVQPEGQVSLPADEALHAESVEWWYWTGHLQDEQGRWYGFEETFFVFQLGVYDAVLSNVGVTDIEAQVFSYDYNHVEGVPEGHTDRVDLVAGADHVVAQGGHDELVGNAGDYVFELTLDEQKPPVFQHGDGYHDYDVGGYTWYYSRQRMAVSGTLNVAGEARPVTGTGWMDHQWGNLLQTTDAGWDWFAIQLDDDREIMLFLVRGSDRIIGGSITGADCATEDLTADRFEVTALGEWTSPVSGCTYPMGWDVRVDDIELTLTPVMEDQELYNERNTYWEGAAVVTGDVEGRAYVELAGYCG